MSNGSRMETLDSLRGVAALSVVLHHIALPVPILYAVYTGEFLREYTDLTWTNRLVHVLAYTPLHLLWGGHEAVVLFFVLSGFVLALPFLSGNSVSYQGYAIKRICRIYPSYILVVTAAGLLMTTLSPRAIPHLSAWFDQMWNEPLSWRIVVDHLLMTGNNTVTINSPTWSLVHEMRISLVFPFLMRIIKKGWRFGLAAAIVLTGCGYLGTNFAPLPINVWDTVHYSGFFVMGALLAKYRLDIASYLQRVPSFGKATLLCTSLLLINWRWEIDSALAFSYPKLSEWVIAAGALLLLTVVLTSDQAASVLRHPWLLWTGKVSYSLYLAHVVVLAALTHLLRDRLPYALIMPLVLLISLILAEILYRWVEVPSISWGRRLAAALERGDRPIRSRAPARNP